MSCETDLADGLRAGGRRLTVQRAKVATALRHAGGHRTAEEILDLVRRDDPQMALPLSTVYRTLSALKDMRLVSEVEAGGRAAYEWVEAGQPHHHLICVDCGAEHDLDPALLDGLRAEIASRAGFEAHLDHLNVSGRCARCAAARRAEAHTG